MNKIIVLLLVTGAFLTGCASPSVEVSEVYQKIELPSQESSGLYGEILLDLGNSALEEDAELSDTLSKWKEINRDVCALLLVESLGIIEPVVKPKVDNKEYLRKNIYGADSLAGTVFLDYRCDINSSPIKMFHGHNMKDGTMFANLPDLFYVDGFEEPVDIELYLEGGKAVYRVFSVVSVDSKEEALPIDMLQDGSDVRSILDDLLERSVVSGGTIFSNDAVILNTCWYGKNGSERNLHCIVAASRVL